MEAESYGYVIDVWPHPDKGTRENTYGREEHNFEQYCASKRKHTNRRLGESPVLRTTRVLQAISSQHLSSFTSLSGQQRSSLNATVASICSIEKNAEGAGSSKYNKIHVQANEETTGWVKQKEAIWAHSAQVTSSRRETIRWVKQKEANWLISARDAHCQWWRQKYIRILSASHIFKYVERSRPSTI